MKRNFATVTRIFGLFDNVFDLNAIYSKLALKWLKLSKMTKPRFARKNQRRKAIYCTSRFKKARGLRKIRVHKGTTQKSSNIFTVIR